MIEIVKNKTCAVTGHRKIEDNIDKKRIEEIFITLISSGINTFLIGMALGFDTLCFNILEKIRENHNIKLVACIPCISQAEKFSDKDKEEYERMLAVADEKIYISKEYTKGCMIKRNIFMIDNCSVLIAYQRRETGGTASTVSYAKKQGIPIIDV